MIARTARSAGTLVLAGSLAVATAGCGLFGSDDAPAPTTTTRRATTTTTTEPSAPEPAVTDPGATPRRELRLTFTPGTKATVAITNDLTVTQEASGRSQTLDIPAIREVVTFTVDRRTADGAAVTFRFDDVTLDRTGTNLTDAEHAKLIEELRTLVGITGTGTITDRGAYTDFAYELPEDLDPDLARQLRELEDQLQSVAVTLPEDPVGVGATWTTTQPIRAGGIRVTQQARYRLTTLDGATAGYAAQVTQTGTRQRITLGSLPDGITATLTRAELTGTVVGTLHLDSPATEATGSLTGDQRITLAGDPSGPLVVTQRVVSTTTVRPAP